MSSLAATQADGYYIPAAYYDNTKAGRTPPSKNQVAAAQSQSNQKGHNQFTQRGIVRFELPYSGLCQQCGQYLGRGSRFNAHKKKVGNYLSTTIWQFEMTCRHCQTQVFLIQTNPQEYGFDYLQGITKLEHKETSTSAPFASSPAITDVQKPLSAQSTTSASETLSMTDMERLERVAHGQRQVLSEYDELQALQRWNAKNYLQDADANAEIRSKFRKERQAHRQRVKQGQQKCGWIKPGMQLLDCDANMSKIARSQRFGPTTTVTQQQQQQQETRYRKVQTSSIFAHGPTKRQQKNSAKATMKRTSTMSPGVVLSCDAVPDVPGSNVVAFPSIDSSINGPVSKRTKRVVQVSAMTSMSTMNGSNARSVAFKTATPFRNPQEQENPSNAASMVQPAHTNNSDNIVVHNDNNTSQPLVSSPSTTTATLPLLVAAYASSDDEED